MVLTDFNFIFYSLSFLDLLPSCTCIPVVQAAVLDTVVEQPCPAGRVAQLNGASKEGAWGQLVTRK